MLWHYMTLTRLIVSGGMRTLATKKTKLIVHISGYHQTNVQHSRKCHSSFLNGVFSSFVNDLLNLN